VRVNVRVDGAAEPSVLRELAVYLDGQNHMRGRAYTLAERQQTTGVSESIAAIVVDLVGPAGLATTFATALVTWIRHRTADTRISISRPDGAKVELSARRVQGLNPAELTTLVSQLAEAVGEKNPE
jgi:hypothetical protein